MNSDLGMMWKEEVEVFSVILSKHFWGVTEKITK
jgi:hypothetical protein